MATFLMPRGGPDHHDRWDALCEQDKQKAYEQGTILALMPPSAARTLRADARGTEGPFTESVEQLGGFYVIDVPTRDDAVELAGLPPKQFAVDIRPGQNVKIG